MDKRLTLPYIIFTDKERMINSRTSSSFKRLFALFTVACSLMAASDSLAADRHIRPSNDVTYNGDGTSWSAAASTGAPGAYKGLPSASTLIRGDVYYVADGAYPGQTFNRAASGTTPITIRKATLANHGSTTGWSDTFGDGQATFSSQLQFTTRYWVIDGVVGGGPPPSGSGTSTWKTGHGFKVTETRSTPVIWVNGGGNVDIRHIDLQGAGNDGAPGGIGNDGVQVYNGQGPVTLSHAYVHDMGRVMFYHGGGSAASISASHSYFGKHESVGAEHSEFAVLRSNALFTLRWSIITHTEGTGGIIAGDNGQTTAEIYGNVFYRDGSTIWGTENNGLIAAFSANSAPVNWKVYNNSFINIPSNLSVFGVAGQNPAGNEARNNIYYLSTNHRPGSGWTQSYEHFSNSGTATGSNSSTSSGDPFGDYISYNFRLKGNTPPGIPLPAPFNIDMYGRQRATWSRGAIELDDSSLNPPTNLRTVGQ